MFLGISPGANVKRAADGDVPSGTHVFSGDTPVRATTAFSAHSAAMQSQLTTHDRARRPPAWQDADHADLFGRRPA
jgi:hypothetical protein